MKNMAWLPSQRCFGLWDCWRFTFGRYLQKLFCYAPTRFGGAIHKTLKIYTAMLPSKIKVANGFHFQT